MRRMVTLATVLLVLLAPAVAMADSNAETPKAGGSSLAKADQAQLAGYVAIAIAIITGVSIIGAGYAVGHIGSAAIGVAGEKPEMMGRSLIFIALGEGLAVLGLAVAFMLLFMVLMPLVK